MDPRGAAVSAGGSCVLDALSARSTGQLRVPGARGWPGRQTGPCRTPTRACTRPHLAGGSEARQCRPADFFKSPYLVLKNIYLYLSSKRSLPSNGAASSVASIFGAELFCPRSLCVRTEASGAKGPPRGGEAPGAGLRGPRGRWRPRSRSVLPEAPGVGRSHSFLSLQCSSDLGSR